MPMRMRTPLPSLDGAAAWENGGKPSDEDLAGAARPRPLLVGQLLHLPQRGRRGGSGWRDTYGPRGLKVIAVHQPRGPEELDIAKVTEDAHGEMGITQPLGSTTRTRSSKRSKTSSSRRTISSTATTS